MKCYDALEYLVFEVPDREPYPNYYISEVVDIITS